MKFFWYYRSRMFFAVSALIPLAGRRERNPVCKKWALVIWFAGGNDLTEALSVLTVAICTTATSAISWGSKITMACHSATSFPRLSWNGLVLPHSWGSKAKANDTFARHAVLSCAVLMHSATGSSVQSLMSSVQRLRGLPRFLVPAIWPWRMEMQRLSALTTCPKYQSFLHYVIQQSCISVQF